MKRYAFTQKNVDEVTERAAGRRFITSCSSREIAVPAPARYQAPRCGSAAGADKWKSPGPNAPWASLSVGSGPYRGDPKPWKQATSM